MNNKTIKNVVIYTLVDTETQIEGFSLEAQRDELIKFCKFNEYHIVNEYEDTGIIAKAIKDRPQFGEMLNEIAKNPKIDAIIGWKLSYLSRSITDLIKMLDILQQYDTGLIAITDQINTFTPIGKTFCYMTNVLAEMERENRVNQIKNGLRQRAKNGLHIGGQTSFGYANKNGTPIQVHPVAAEIIRTIYDLYANNGFSYSKICRVLNREPEKYPSRTGNGWTYYSVQLILDNPIYHGYVCWDRQERWNKQRNGTSDNCTLVKGRHEPIINDELWERTQARRQQQQYPKTEIVRLTKFHSAVASHIV